MFEMVDGWAVEGEAFVLHPVLQGHYHGYGDSLDQARLNHRIDNDTCLFLWHTG